MTLETASVMALTSENILLINVSRSHQHRNGNRNTSHQWPFEEIDNVEATSSSYIVIIEGNEREMKKWRNGKKKEHQSRKVTLYREERKHRKATSMKKVTWKCWRKCYLAAEKWRKKEKSKKATPKPSIDNQQHINHQSKSIKKEKAKHQPREIVK